MFFSFVTEDQRRRNRVVADKIVSSVHAADCRCPTKASSEWVTAIRPARMN